MHAAWEVRQGVKGVVGHHRVQGRGGRGRGRVGSPFRWLVVERVGRSDGTGPVPGGGEMAEQ